MSTTIVNFFANGQYEEVIRETENFLRRLPANTTAVHLKAQAHYQIGEYDACIRLLERAIVYLAGRETLETRLRLTGLLANALLEQGRYEEVRSLVEHSVPAGAVVCEEHGELLVAAAWAAFFLHQLADAEHLVERVIDITDQPFTLGRAALCAALNWRREGDVHRSKSFLVQAHNHFAHANNLFGNPAPVLRLFQLQVQIARRGSAADLARVHQEFTELPNQSRIAELLREAVALYEQWLGNQLDPNHVTDAVARGVKRAWVALLPGAEVVTEIMSTEDLPFRAPTVPATSVLPFGPPDAPAPEPVVVEAASELPAVFADMLGEDADAATVATPEVVPAEAADDDVLELEALPDDLEPVPEEAPVEPAVAAVVEPTSELVELHELDAEPDASEILLPPDLDLDETVGAGEIIEIPDLDADAPAPGAMALPYMGDARDDRAAEPADEAESQLPAAADESEADIPVIEEVEVLEDLPVLEVAPVAAVIPVAAVAPETPVAPGIAAGVIETLEETLSLRDLEAELAFDVAPEPAPEDLSLPTGAAVLAEVTDAPSMEDLDLLRVPLLQESLPEMPGAALAIPELSAESEASPVSTTPATPEAPSPVSSVVSAEPFLFFDAADSFTELTVPTDFLTFGDLESFDHSAAEFMPEPPPAAPVEATSPAAAETPAPVDPVSEAAQQEVDALLGSAMLEVAPEPPAAPVALDPALDPFPLIPEAAAAPPALPPNVVAHDRDDEAVEEGDDEAELTGAEPGEGKSGISGVIRDLKAAPNLGSFTDLDDIFKPEEPAPAKTRPAVAARATPAPVPPTRTPDAPAQRKPSDALVLPSRKPPTTVPGPSAPIASPATPVRPTTPVAPPRDAKTPVRLTAPPTAPKPPVAADEDIPVAVPVTPVGFSLPRASDIAAHLQRIQAQQQAKADSDELKKFAATGGDPERPTTILPKPPGGVVSKTPTARPNPPSGIVSKTPTARPNPPSGVVSKSPTARPNPPSGVVSKSPTARPNPPSGVVSKTPTARPNPPGGGADPDAVPGASPAVPRAKTAVRPAPAAPDPAQARQQAAQGTILLVEPSAKTAKLLEECLRDTTFRITKVVPDVDRGYEAYLMSRPSLVLIDLHAPGVSQASAPGAPAFVKGFFELDPFARMVALSDERTRPLATEAVRIGARAYLEQPLTRSGVLEVLSRSLTVRTPAEAMRVPTLEWKRPVACSWRSVDAAAKGLAGSWQSVVARSLDPNGMETNLNVALKPGTIVRMNVELPGSGKPLLTLAEVVHAKSDPVLHHHVTRFVFLKLAAEGKDRLLKFLTDAAAKHAK